MKVFALAKTMKVRFGCSDTNKQVHKQIGVLILIFFYLGKLLFYSKIHIFLNDGI